MPARKPFLKTSELDEALVELLQESKDSPVTEEELREQRVSFAFGNALGSEKITKDSVREASKSIRLVRQTG